MHPNLPALTEVLDDIEFFERERTPRHIVELAILLYDSGASLRKVQRVLSWLGIERSHVAIWKWIQKFGAGLTATGQRAVAELPPIVLLDETAISQHGQQFTLFAAVNPETLEVVHLSVVPVRNYLTTRRLISDDAGDYGPVFAHLRIARVVLDHGIRNRIERWLQELKRRIDTFYASFTGHDVTPPTAGSASSPGSGTPAYVNTAASSAETTISYL